MEYLNFFRALYEQQVRYLICGGLAVNIYGIPRMTADIDILLDFSPENLSKFDLVIKKLSFQAIIPVALESMTDESKRKELVLTKNLIAYSFYNTRSNYMNVDVLIDVPISFNELWDARESRPMDDIKVFIVSLDHLIEMKQYANRNQDKQDVLLLSKLKDKFPSPKRNQNPTA